MKQHFRKLIEELEVELQDLASAIENIRYSINHDKNATVTISDGINLYENLRFSKSDIVVLLETRKAIVESKINDLEELQLTLGI